MISVISFKEFKEKLNAGESIEELAQKYRVQFGYDEICFPQDIPVEKLVEIIEKAPELLTEENNIPVWVFLLLLVKEKFNIIEKIIYRMFHNRWCGLKYDSTDDIPAVVNAITSINNQITNEQISVLLSVMEERKGFLFMQPKSKIVDFIINHFFYPLKGYLNDEHFISIFDWLNKTIGHQFFREFSFDFFKGFPAENQLVQENLVNYFISAPANWIIKPKALKFNLFKRKEILEKINVEFFVSSVVKSFSKLHNYKKAYLLNFPYFLENYPQLAIESLKAFMDNIFERSYFINVDNKVFIPNEIWDILSKKDLNFIYSLINNLPCTIFSFDTDYVTKFIILMELKRPEIIHDRLKILKRIFTETPVYKIIEEIMQEVSDIRETNSSKLLVNVLKFIFDRFPANIAYELSREIVPYKKFSNWDNIYDKEDIESKLWDIKPQLIEVLSYFDEMSQTDCLSDNSNSLHEEQYSFCW